MSATAGRELAHGRAKAHVADTELIFVSLHYLMALVSAGGQRDAADEMIARHPDMVDHWMTRKPGFAPGSGMALAEGLRDARSPDTPDGRGRRGSGTVRYRA